jgi:hypothetical protein
MKVRKIAVSSINAIDDQLELTSVPSVIFWEQLKKSMDPLSTSSHDVPFIINPVSIEIERQTFFKVDYSRELFNLLD